VVCFSSLDLPNDLAGLPIEGLRFEEFRRRDSAVASQSVMYAACRAPVAKQLQASSTT
jgi:hypothetical protein